MNGRLQFSLGQLFASTAFFAVATLALLRLGEARSPDRVAWFLICFGSCWSGIGALTSRNPAALAFVGVYIGMFGLILGTIFTKGLLD